MEPPPALQTTTPRVEGNSRAHRPPEDKKDVKVLKAKINLDGQDYRMGIIIEAPREPAKRIADAIERALIKRGYVELSA